MKRLGCVGLIIILCAGMLAGCGSSFEADTNSVYVEKNGTVLSIDVEELGESYYDETELKEFVDSAVEEYTSENGKNSVRVSDLSVTDGNAKLKMEYKTPEDYTAFNGIELYQGKVVQALAAGYTLDADWKKVEDGAVTGSALKSEIDGQGDLKIVIIKANINVQIDGTILYVSSENVTVTGKNTIAISGESFETDVYTYIIYK